MRLTVRGVAKTKSLQQKTWITLHVLLLLIMTHQKLSSFKILVKDLQICSLGIEETIKKDESVTSAIEEVKEPASISIKSNKRILIEVIIQ